MEQVNVMSKLNKLVSALSDSASNEGCTDDLVVVSAANLWELQQFVRLLPEANDAAGCEKDAVFIKDVAEMSIWDYGKHDGSMYNECEEPRDGYLDSHLCLMELIERAREIRGE